MAISPNLTFVYQFAAECQPGHLAASIATPDPASAGASHDVYWTGQGSGQSSFGEVEGMVGPRPRFELRGGWLTLFPTDGWTHSFPIHWFSDVERPPRATDSAAQLAAIQSHSTLWQAAQQEAHKEAASQTSPGDFISYTKAVNDARERALRRRGMTRDLASYAVFVGEALGKVLRNGDELRFARDGGGDFRYSVRRKAEIVFSAGSVGSVDEGGPVAVWQEYDRLPNQNADALTAKFPDMRVAEWIYLHRPYVTARVRDQVFHLSDGEEVHAAPYYVFLARSNRNTPAFAVEFTPRAVHSLSSLDEPGQELIIDAARQLARPQVKTL